MFEFWKNEWQLFLEDIDSIKGFFGKVFTPKNKYLMLQSASTNSQTENNEEEKVEEYVPDAVDHKVSAYFGEDIDTIRNNMSGDKTQHEVLRSYAQYFKPYTVEADMCNGAFKKYYDRHALKIATSELPIEQARIIQNNVDLFIKGQEVFGENNQFIDSRVDSIFEKAGIDQVEKVVNILHDNNGEAVNAQGERLFAEIVNYMVDNGIKIEKDGSLLEPVKQSLEEKLDEVHSELKSHDNWNDEYQSLISQERKYLYALNRIEQYETEQRIAEFEQKLSNIDVG